jgi:glycosyltransferase involved in cell wall biosynthesis
MMTDLSNTHLILFLTKGTTLGDWHTSGLLAREAELYLHLRPHLGSIAWVTYGGRADLDYQDMLPGIDILVNRWRLPNQVYIQQLPWLHRWAFQRATILKSEQTGAAEAAIRIAQHFGKRYIARSGFSLSLFAQYEPEQFSEQYEQILAQEKHSFEIAQQVVVTTQEMRQVAIETHHISPDKIRVIPNYINTHRFCPPENPIQTEKPYLVFVGRLVPQKNVDAFLTAVAPLKHTQVDIIGNGDLRDHLAGRIEREGLYHVRLLGNVPNHQLPQYFQRATLYVQPSRYEGHPKTIFEAMACGTPVLAGDAPGVRQFIQHGETGWLCGLAAEDIRQGIETLLADEGLRIRLGRAGREYVVKHFAFETVVAQELSVLTAVAALPEPAANPQPRPILRSVLAYGERVGWLIRTRLTP